MLYADLLNSKGSLEKLMSLDLPIVISYKLSKCIDLLNKELEHIENFRVELVKKHGSTDEQGNIKVLEENVDEFSKEYTSLMETEVDDLTFPEIKLSQIQNMSLSAIDINKLYKLGILNDDLE